MIDLANITPDVESMLYRTMEGECIRCLMSGNDTQCFTTQQYYNMRDVVIARMVGATREECGCPAPPLESARRQLAASGLVTEVSTDVWTLTEGVFV